MGHTSVVRIVLVGALVAAGFAACAEGQQLMGGAGGGAGGSSTASGPPPGMVGSPCRSQQDCGQGTCTPVGGNSYCTVPCPPACPGATYCSIIGGTPICVPDLDQECDKCSLDSDCKLPSDVCLTAPLGDNFCARDCTVDGLCPEGFSCEGKAAYEPGDAGAGDAGTGGGGAGDAGTGGGSAGAGGTGSAAPDAGTTTPTMPTQWCVPSGGGSCPCDSKRNGVTNACSISNDLGTCTGLQTCNGSQGVWQGCSAPTPPGPVQSCTCVVDASEPNDLCAMATPAGTVTDTGAPISFEGTLSSATDVDVWSFVTVDTTSTTTNAFHVNLVFTQPSPNTEFVMDVERGDPCTDTPSGAPTNITTYDWCVNGTGGPTLGEGTCGPTAAVHCVDHGGNYYVRVHRAAGVTPTCTPYQIVATAAGGSCDFTMMCESP